MKKLLFLVLLSGCLEKTREHNLRIEVCIAKTQDEVTCICRYAEDNECYELEPHRFVCKNAMPQDMVGADITNCEEEL